MKITKDVVKLKSGLYAKDWEYSQGWFDVVETPDIFQACPVSDANFKTFFKNKGGVFQTVEFEMVATIVKEEKL